MKSEKASKSQNTSKNDCSYRHFEEVKAGLAMCDKSRPFAKEIDEINKRLNEK